MPAMEAAQNALKALNKADINELKAFQKPPALVRFVMEPVCILLGAKYVKIILLYLLHHYIHDSYTSEIK